MLCDLLQHVIVKSVITFLSHNTVNHTEENYTILYKYWEKCFNTEQVTVPFRNAHTIWLMVNFLEIKLWFYFLNI